MGEAAYSFSLTTFSPSGKLYQIEHALKRVAAGQLALAIQSVDGCVIATTKKLPTPLMLSESVHKIEKICDSIGMVFAGMSGDFRVLVRKGRKRAQEYFLKYNQHIPTKIFVREIATIMQEYTQAGGVRPFGVSVLIIGYDHEGPQLFQADPSGAFFQWNATAIGDKSTNARTFLSRRYDESMELEDAVQCLLLTMKDGFDGEMTPDNIEIGIIDSDKKFSVLDTDAVRDYIAEAE